MRSLTVPDFITTSLAHIMQLDKQAAIAVEDRYPATVSYNDRQQVWTAPDK